jgi:hypothetical protein
MASDSHTKSIYILGALEQNTAGNFSELPVTERRTLLRKSLSPALFSLLFYI